MKRKALIFLVTGATFLSGLGGVASLLATAPNSTELEPSVQIQQNHTEKAPIAIAGNSWGGFGDPGEGYFRIALTVSKERLQEAIDRIKEVGF